MRELILDIVIGGLHDLKAGRILAGERVCESKQQFSQKQFIDKRVYEPLWTQVMQRCSLLPSGLEKFRTWRQDLPDLDLKTGASMVLRKSHSSCLLILELGRDPSRCAEHGIYLRRHRQRPGRGDAVTACQRSAALAHNCNRVGTSKLAARTLQQQPIERTTEAMFRAQNNKD
jgi:hypothetical protein